MKASFYQRQIAELIEKVKLGAGDEAEATSVLNANEMRDDERRQAEIKMFESLPQIVAHSSQLQGKGAYLVQELYGKSVLLTRGSDGKARAFLNYCQHRGTKLEQTESGCKSRFSCPYHAWTYDLQGGLVGVPRADLFPGLDKSTKSLRELRLQEAFGFLWLTMTSVEKDSEGYDINEYLGGLTDELSALDFASSSVYFDETRHLKSDWKLPIYAFLESYHIGTLHKNSIAEFFIENIAISEMIGPHLRSFVPRKNVMDLESADLDQVSLPEYITPTNILFPNACMIAHPSSYTIILMQPGDKVGECTWRHMLLVPEQPTTDAAKAHYDKTLAVLDQTTYEKEDMWASEQIQEGINAGAIDELLLAKHEQNIKHFSDLVSERIAE
ncbi:MAG TPA: hypothetical protein DCW52_00705 [Gammaproteobacteria bacterium]|nr:hypothetical protein [Gammaproteobacteria bacterium]